MKKTAKTKQLILEQLRKTPIIEAACQKMGISRMTFYRWKDKDKEFSKMVDEAIFDGCLLVNDLAENQLISAVKSQNMQGIMYWLKHHHTSYTTRVELNGRITHLSKELSDEEKELVEKALRLAMPTQKHDDTDNKQ